jgi:hypothetical protein
LAMSMERLDLRPVELFVVVAQELPLGRLGRKSPGAHPLRTRFGRVRRPCAAAARLASGCAEA